MYIYSKPEIYIEYQMPIILHTQVYASFEVAPAVYVGRRSTGLCLSAQQLLLNILNKVATRLSALYPKLKLKMKLKIGYAKLE